MEVLSQDDIEAYQLLGVSHRTLADRTAGLEDVEFWRQVMEPGAETPIHWHWCTEAVMVLSGAGQAIVEAGAASFSAGVTLTFEPGEIHQLVNRNDEPVELVAVLNESPARVFTPEGELVGLPWQSVGDVGRSRPSPATEELKTG